MNGTQTFQARLAKAYTAAGRHEDAAKAEAHSTMKPTAKAEEMHRRAREAAKAWRELK